MGRPKAVNGWRPISPNIPIIIRFKVQMTLSTHWPTDKKTCEGEACRSAVTKLVNWRWSKKGLYDSFADQCSDCLTGYNAGVTRVQKASQIWSPDLGLVAASEANNACLIRGADGKCQKRGRKPVRGCLQKAKHHVRVDPWWRRDVEEWQKLGSLVRLFH